LRSIVPFIFVLIWSTGFIVARAASPHADLDMFLLLRFTATAAILGVAAMLAKVRWPRGREMRHHLLAGILMQGIYLCASYWAIVHGLAAGVMALLGALQPLFTALASTLLGNRLGRQTWAGLAVGLVGVCFVLLPRLLANDANALPPIAVIAALVSIISITVGTMMQKSAHAGGDIRAVGAIQNIGGALVAACFIAVLGTWHVRPDPILVAALGWSVIIVSVIGINLLVWMVRHGEATRATTLLLLSPPLSAVEAYLLFGETLSAIQIAGFVLALSGVLLARRG